MWRSATMSRGGIAHHDNGGVKNSGLQKGFKAVVDDDKPQADIRSEIRVHFALHRRGVVCAAVGLLDWQAHAMLVSTLWVKHLSIPLPSQGKLTLEHLRKADEFIWTKLAYNIKDVVDGQRFPCNEAWH
eukprot:5163887-Amphidinium_carterae.1